MRITRLTFTAITLAMFSSLAQAENWPQWRGAAFNGSSTEKNLPESWTKETVKWAVPLPGPSGATPAVWGDAVFLTSPDAQKNLLLICVNRKDGKVRWQKQITSGDINKGKGNMASPSPVTDGKSVFVLFGTGDFAAVDFDGNILWQRNLGADYGRFAIMWLYGSSPLLFNGKLYLQVLQRTPAPADYPGLAGGDPARGDFRRRTARRPGGLAGCGGVDDGVLRVGQKRRVDKSLTRDGNRPEKGVGVLHGYKMSIWSSQRPQTGSVRKVQQKDGSW